ncbi:MAG: EAL domain-containing protein [Alphaproteobacteria bacterium]|nr:EAL domain-containing protein [Alphaproteobacteria bacterium]
MSAFAVIAAAAPVDPSAMDFAGPDGVVEIRDTLKPYHAPSGANRPDKSGWFLIAVTNSAIRPVARVLQAAQPQSVSFRILPRPTRPAIVGVASSDPLVSIAQMNAYGRHTYRVIVPPASTVALAVQMVNTPDPPVLLAWTEPALAAHNRQLAIFTTAVWAVIGAAALLAAGLAIMLGHAPARWGAITLLLVLLERLSETGLFDGSIATAVGGPYGLMAMLAAFALAAGAALADAIVPIHDLWPNHTRNFRLGLYSLCGLGIAAYLGIPAAAVLTDTIVVLGSLAVAGYLIYRGRFGAQAARVAAPSALVFALVALASVAATVNNAGESWATSAAGGFAAAASLLLALAIAAGEGIAVLPFQSMASMPDLEPLPADSADEAMQAIGASHQGVFDLDFEAETLRLSREACALIGVSERATPIAHADWVQRIHADDRETYADALNDYRSHPGLAFRVEFRVRAEGVRYPWIELRSTMLGERAPATRCLGLMADVTTRKEHEAHLLERTMRDPLTGLGNRVAMMEELENLAGRFADTTFAVVDIDRFKSIHASLGDDGADAVLAKVAERIATRFPDARVFRVGGDAFAFVFVNAESRPETIGHALLDVGTDPYAHDGRNIFAPVSAGVALGRDARDPLDLLKNAELALGNAKRAGGGCARVYAPDMEAATPGDSVALEADLRRAIADKQLDVYYQPIVRLSDGAIAGFEALLRWKHPTKGLIAPAEFIAHSEETGTIVALGRVALERAAHDIAQWQRFFPLDPPLFVSVNVSRRQLRDQDFNILLGALLRRENVAPGTLHLEVTESVVAANHDAQEALAHARALGAGISIDDFGTGTSSLSQLRTLPFDTIKIDQSFLAKHTDEHANADGAVVLKSIVALAHDLNRSVVVEGVERKEDAEWIAELGCEYAQGFYFAQPLPAPEAMKFIAMHFDASRASGLPRQA